MNYIVTTTINLPTNLKDYVIDFKDHGHDYLIIVVGDQKTPNEVGTFCDTLDSVIYIDIKAQEQLYNNLPIYSHIPFNSVQRRNLGYLFCFQEGISQDDILITIDDDNLLNERDFLGKHGNGEIIAETLYSSKTEWFNPLSKFYSENIVPRGFSLFNEMINESFVKVKKKKKIPIAVNAGLWEENPDIYAITRMQEQSRNKSKYKVFRDEPLVLSNNVWSSFNSQNTSYLNEFWLTAYLCPYIGRFDDIFSSFITTRIAYHLGFGISFGKPIVTQQRNEHDLFNDFLLELHGMAIVDKFVSFLSDINIVSTTILECYSEILKHIKNDFTLYVFDQGGHPFGRTPWDMNKLIEGMELWLESIDHLNINHNKLL